MYTNRTTQHTENGSFLLVELILLLYTHYIHVFLWINVFAICHDFRGEYLYSLSLVLVLLLLLYDSNKW